MPSSPLMWSECSWVMKMAERFSGVAADAGEALADLARRKAGVHEDAGFGGFEVGAIAGRTAAENGELDGHGGKLKRKAESGKRKTRGQFFSR